MNPKKLTCGVIVVTHNSELHIHKAVQCLNRQTIPPDHIVIVDSGSKNTDYLSSCKQPNLQIVLARNDIGFCKGNNIGMKHIPLHCDYVFFLNPDAFPAPDYIEGALAFMENSENQKVSALTGPLLGYDIHLDKPTGKYDSTGVFNNWYGKWYDRGQGQVCKPEQFQVKETLPAICGASLFCRKKALDSVLLRGSEVFDNSFYMYKEDIDLSLRLRRQGWKLAFVPQLTVYHCRGWNRDRSKMPRKMRLASAYNELRINARRLSVLGTAYSLLKYTAVQVLDM